MTANREVTFKFGAAARRIEQAVVNIELYACVISLISIMIFMTISVAFRFFNLAVLNMAEWAIVAMSPLTFIGAAVCTFLNRHIRVEVVEMFASPLFRKLFHGIILLSQVAFSIVFGLMAWEFLDYEIYSGERLADLGTPVWIPALTVFIGTALIGVHAVSGFVRLCSGEEQV